MTNIALGVTNCILIKNLFTNVKRLIQPEIHANQSACYSKDSQWAADQAHADIRGRSDSCAGHGSCSRTSCAGRTKVTCGNGSEDRGSGASEAVHSC